MTIGSMPQMPPRALSRESLRYNSNVPLLQVAQRVLNDHAVFLAAEEQSDGRYGDAGGPSPGGTDILYTAGAPALTAPRGRHPVSRLRMAPMCGTMGP